MSTARARLMRRARRYLAIWKENIGLDNELGLTDINSDAEDFCCGLLNIMLGARLQNKNLLQMNFPAIDLADDEGRICVQVTSTAGAEKITHTLERFFAHGLEKRYDRLIVMILGNKKKYRTEFPQKEGFRFEPMQDVWDIQKLLTCLAGLSMPVLERVDGYLREQFSDLGELAPPMELPVLSALDDATFLGRSGELADIAGRFESGEKLVFLSGLGGIGKSELAVRFAQTRWGGESYFVHFTKNWRQTVLENIAPRIRGLNREGADEDRIFRDAMAELKSRSAEELLIIDNVNQEEASLTRLKRELSALDMRVIVTTRTDAERAIRVARLPQEELLQLFELHESNASPEERRALIEAVDGHTLTVDLMARALRPGRRAATARKLLNDLGDGTIRRVATAYPGGPDQARILEHLKVVFRVSELGEEEKTLLRHATLLPAGGMEDALFLPDPDDAMDDALTGLTDNGWLNFRDELLSIHPVIRRVCREELTPTDENCVGFLEGLIGQYDENEFRQEHCRQLAEVLTNASVRLADTQGQWALKAGERWRDIGALDQAHACSLRAMEKMETNLSPDAPELAHAYNNVGVTYGELGDHRKALEYQQKALTIRERVLSEDHTDLAQSYNNVGTTYSDLGDHRKALEYQKRALDIWEKVFSEEHPDVARAYNNVGTDYSNLGDYRKAMECQQKAMRIREKVLPVDHPDLAVSYSSVGGTYSGLSDHRKALEYHQKALDIWEKALPEKHPDVARAYNNVGGTYGDLGDHRKALEYQQKALDIWKKVLPADHPDLALSCNNIAWTYRDLGDLSAAARYMRRAAEIIGRSTLPETHPNRVNYPKWAEKLEKEAKIQQDILSKMQSPGPAPFPFGKK